MYLLIFKHTEAHLFFKQPTLSALHLTHVKEYDCGPHHPVPQENPRYQDTGIKCYGTAVGS